MKKKIVLGSIFAVAILIFLSFNNVGGNKTNNSDSIYKSPLFDIRTSRAIEQDKSFYSNDYIGKGKDTELSFPIRNKDTKTITELLGWITNIDKKSFNNFKYLLMNQLNNENKLSNTQIHRLLTTLYQIREKPEIMKNFFGDTNRFYDGDTDAVTFWMDCTWYVWVPGCFLYYFYMAIQIILRLMFSSLRPTCLNYNTCGWTCYDSFCLIGCGIE